MSGPRDRRRTSMPPAQALVAPAGLAWPAPAGPAPAEPVRAGPPPARRPPPHRTAAHTPRPHAERAMAPRRTRPVGGRLDPPHDLGHRQVRVPRADQGGLTGGEGDRVLRTAALELPGPGDAQPGDVDPGSDHVHRTRLIVPGRRPVDVDRADPDNAGGGGRTTR